MDTQLVFVLLLFVFSAFTQQLSLIQDAEFDVENNEILLASKPMEKGAAWNLTSVISTIGFTASFQ